MDARSDLQLAFSLPCMRKLFLLTFMLLLSVPVLANDNEEAKIKAAVEDRYKDWIAAANKKDTAALTDLYDENAVLMPKEEEPVIGKAAIGEYYKNLSPTRTLYRSR
jgi:hypothetical protein